MGIVWRAHDELLDRTVAVKEVRYSSDLGEEVQLLNRRTMREARAAARFEHPNVIVVYDVIEEDDQPWIVMQMVPSRSLGTVIKKDGPLPYRRVAEIGLAVLDALHGAHEAGVLHRDVKPENVLLADDGRVVLTDFGIATLETETQLTMTGLAGTPAFIAPERLKGLPARRESDLWSLGATLYTAVEGRAPHERGMVMATMHAVLNDDPAPPAKAGPLAPVILGLLAREPEDRLSYGDAMRKLRDVSAPERPAAPPPTLRNVTQRAHTEVMPVEDDTPTDPNLRPVPPAPARSAKASAQAARSPEPPALPETGARLAPERTVEADRPGNRKVGAIVAVVAAVAVVAGLGTWLGMKSAGDPESTVTPQSQAAKASSTPSSTPSASQQASESPSAPPTTAAPSPTPSASTEPPKAALPDGWKMYKDESGFQVGLPKGWEPYKREGSQVFFRGPGAASNAFMAIDQVKKAGPDPVADWKRSDKGAPGRFGGYKLVGIKAVDYMEKAADWEFTWVTNSGKTRVLNRGFVTKGGMGYSIYWHNLDSRWKKDFHFFETFADTFKPAK